VIEPEEYARKVECGDERECGEQPNPKLYLIKKGHFRVPFPGLKETISCLIPEVKWRFTIFSTGATWKIRILRTFTGDGIKS
jgi:hypothetical protein